MFRNNTTSASFFCSSSLLLGFGSLSVAYNALSSEQPQIIGVKLGAIAAILLFGMFNFGMVVRVLTQTAYTLALPTSDLPEALRSAGRSSTTASLPDERDTASFVRSEGNGAVATDEMFEHHVRCVQRSMLRSQRHWWVGMRMFYFCVPLVFWCIGDVAFLLATGLVVLTLRFHDAAD